MKKNCENCKHIEFAFGDVGDPEGFVCNKKDLYDKEEKKMLWKMSKAEYRLKSKVCFEPRVKK